METRPIEQDQNITFTQEWLAIIVVGVVSLVFGRLELRPLSLCCTLADAALFVAVLAHELDPARPRRPQGQSLSRGSSRRKSDSDRGSEEKSLAETEHIWIARRTDRRD